MITGENKMDQIIVAGNWKMNKTLSEAIDFTASLIGLLEGQNLSLSQVVPVICTPYPYINDLAALCKASEIKVAAQDVSMHEFGAYTGEVSAPMLASLGVEYCIIGHSERRLYHNETDEMIRSKLLRLTDSLIIPIICIGEKEEEREQGITKDVILSQLGSIFRDIDISDFKRIVIAYEPVWAIGTGKTATPDMAQEVHHLIREWLKKNYSTEIAEDIPILYGGSVKPDNFHTLLQQKDINGGLIGGASLKLEDFCTLITSAVEKSEEV